MKTTIPKKIPSKKLSKLFDMSLICKMYNQGISIEEIARQNGYGTTWVRALLNQAAKL